MDADIEIKLEKFFRQYKAKKYKRREILIRAAEEPDGLFFLKEGVVRQYAISAKGEELTINVFKPFSFFPMAWIVNDSISPHFFEAMTAVSVWIAPKKDVLRFIKKEPDTLLYLIKRIYKGLDGYFIRMEHLMLGSAQARLIAELLIYARRFGEKKETQIHINFKITEKDLAAQSGIARETVSREIQKLKQKGLVDFEKNRLTIIDIRRMEEELLLI